MHVFLHNLVTFKFCFFLEIQRNDASGSLVCLEVPKRLHPEIVRFPFLMLNSFKGGPGGYLNFKVPCAYLPHQEIRKTEVFSDL